MRSRNLLLIRGIALTAALLLMCAPALANTGKETDPDGGVWDWDSGTYTTPDGRVFPIAQEGSAEESAEEIQWNEDGSMTVESGQLQAPAEKKEGKSGDEIWAEGVSRAAIVNGSYTPTFYFDGTGSLEEVSVEYMGVYRSMVRLNGENKLVDTANLIWTTEAPLDKVLAVVTAKTYARLFAKSSKKSLIMDKVYCGTVLRVLDTDKNWTFVDYNGMRGYIQTASLRFYENEAREYRCGFVSTKSGHPYGDSTVKVRSQPNGSIRGEYRVGTPITVFEDDGTWCRIEVQGQMCYILRQFMVYDEGQQTAAAEGES